MGLLKILTNNQELSLLLHHPFHYIGQAVSVSVREDLREKIYEDYVKAKTRVVFGIKYAIACIPFLVAAGALLSTMQHNMGYLPEAAGGMYMYNPKAERDVSIEQANYKKKTEERIRKLEEERMKNPIYRFLKR